MITFKTPKLYIIPTRVVDLLDFLLGDFVNNGLHFEELVEAGQAELLAALLVLIGQALLLREGRA